MRIVSDGSGNSRSALARAAHACAWVGGIALALVMLELLGVPVFDWIRQLFKEIRTVPAGAVVGGVVLETLQTVFAAIAWLTILRAAFPDRRCRSEQCWRPTPTAVALNGFSAREHRHVGDDADVRDADRGGDVRGDLLGFLVQKIPFTVLSVAVYMYLFATVPGSLSVDLGFCLQASGAVHRDGARHGQQLFSSLRYFWNRASKLREKIKSGGAVLGQRRRFMVGVALPEVASFSARLGIVAVFLAGFSIPVTLHTIVAVTGANSVSSSLSVTPGGVGITQALNVVVLESVTSPRNATAYSVAQRPIVSAWDIVFAVALVAWVFGWSGGKQLPP